VGLGGDFVLHFLLLKGLDGVLTRCNSVSLLLIHEIWVELCTHLPLLQTFMKSLMELFPIQCSVDT